MPGRSGFIGPGSRRLDHSVARRADRSSAFATLPTDDPDSLGRIGVYEVTGVVGSGGMGVVLKARDHTLDRVVAVKVMAPHLAASGSARQRFAREAKAAAAVLHPNVIAIHGVSNEQALPYLVMPYVRGVSLQKRLDAEGPLPLVDILRIGTQVAAGLAAAHEQGLVHRDIKPGNILLEQGVERVTITDFGLARAVDDASMTRSGVIAGTPQYMSPEQAQAEKIDHRSDLFSLGSVLYAMCTGHPPFRAESSFGVLRLIADKEPRAIRETNPNIPNWLCVMIRKLMAKHAEDRFDSAQEVSDLLERCVAHVQQPLEFDLPMTPKFQSSDMVTTDLSQWSKCVFSSPEHQQSLFGRHVWPFGERGKIRLTDRTIEWAYNSGLHQTVPLSCIEEVSIGHYSRLTHPMRMDYLSIRYRDGDSIHTQLLTPLASLLTPVSSANAAVRRYANQLPQPIIEAASKASQRSWSIKFVAASVFLWLLLFCGILVVLEWNKGTLRIESEVDDVPIRIVQSDDIVKELTVSKSGKSVRIAAGNCEIEIGGRIDGLSLDNGTVLLRRGGNDIVRIVRTSPVASALGDWPYGRLLKDLQAIKPPGGVPVTSSGAPIRVAMGVELRQRL
ncbi:MAG: serine/threonine-protein kinase, partial [Pirellulaceae bacterium]